MAGTIASAAMIAQQVAGKAARDAMYLSNFSVKTLPLMMAVSAVLSLGAVLLFSRVMTRHSPAKVVPLGFALSGAVFVGEWFLSFPMPRVAAVLVYLHTALFGAAAISAFWSLINERFDPHSGKRAASWIAGGGTFGGALGGFAAWRASSFIAVPTMLPCLAGVNLICLWGILQLRGAPTQTALVADDSAPDSTEEQSPLRILRGAPYLRNLAIVVALGAVTSGLLDYVFSAEATRAYAKGPPLLSFFAQFWLVVGLFSFVLQMALGRVALEKLGLVVTIAFLPSAVVFGGALGLAVPGLWSTSILRGGEAASRNSIFRAAYEMLYTPLSEKKKRATKTIIDVGFDRVGTVTASGIAALAVYLAGARAENLLVGLSVLFAIGTLTRSRPLQRGYIEVLEESLRKEGEKLAPSSERSDLMRPTLERVEVRDKIVEQLKALPRSEELAAIASGETKLEPVPPQDRPSLLQVSLLDYVDPVAALCSGAVERARPVLASKQPLATPLVPFAILLLARKEIHRDALVALRSVATKATGQLVDALCDAANPFDVRRRIPRVLSSCKSQQAADGLLRGAEDERFEVRYECGRALLKITGADSPVVIGLDRVVAIVKHEVAISKEVWESQPTPEFDDEEDAAPALIDRLLRDRIDRSMEHVFTLLALQLDRESLRIAFKALHEEDERLRGTALEYLETVLPEDVRDAVWPFIGEDRPMRPARPVAEILQDLVRARQVVGPKTPVKAHA